MTMTCWIPFRSRACQHKVWFEVLLLGILVKTQPTPIPEDPCRIYFPTWTVDLYGKCREIYHTFIWIQWDLEFKNRIRTLICPTIVKGNWNESSSKTSIFRGSVGFWRGGCAAFFCGKSRPQTKGHQFSGKGDGRLRVERPASASSYGEPVIKVSRNCISGILYSKLVSQWSGTSKLEWFPARL